MSTSKIEVLEKLEKGEITAEQAAELLAQTNEPAVECGVPEVECCGCEIADPAGQAPRAPEPCRVEQKVIVHVVKPDEGDVDDEEDEDNEEDAEDLEELLEAVGEMESTINEIEEQAGEMTDQIEEMKMQLDAFRTMVARLQEAAEE